MKYKSKYGYKLEKRELDAGYDLRSPKDMTLKPGEIGIIDTGICIDFPDNMMGIVAPRSSSSKTGLELTNTIGIIDPSYRGRNDRLIAKVCCRNTHEYLYIKKGEKFAQIFFLEIPETEMELVDEFDEREDRGGFGSTGTH